jgi:DNA-binding transcriptional LysR family regulator
MELRYLRCFVAVAEELNFTRAAERLHMAQPPLSMQIRKLEGELGVALFTRSKRHVAMTDAGQVFLGEARQLLAMAERAAAEARWAAAGTAGRLAIGFVGSAATAFLPEVVRSYRTVRPRVALAMYELTTTQQLDALRRGDIVAGFLRPPVEGGDRLAVEVVQREPLLAALPAGHSLVEREEVPLALLADEDFITFQRDLGPGLHSQIHDLCRRAGFVPRVAHEAGQMLTIVSLVSAGLGVAVVPASMRCVFRGSVAYRPLADESAPAAELALAWRQDDGSGRLGSFVEVARRVGRRGSAETLLQRQLAATEQAVVSRRAC